MPAETRNRGRHRKAAIPAARHDDFTARAKFEGRRRTAGIAQFLAAAARALRAGRYMMLHNGRAQQVEADDVIAQLRAKIGGDRSRDLDGRKFDGALSEGPLSQRRNSDAASLSAV